MPTFYIAELLNTQELENNDMYYAIEKHINNPDKAPDPYPEHIKWDVDYADAIVHGLEKKGKVVNFDF